jgi:hypothetical protein
VSLNWFSEQTTIIFPNVISRIDLFRNILSVRCVFKVKTMLCNMIRIPIALEIFRHATRMVLPVANAALLADRRGLSGISCVRSCSDETKRCPARSWRGRGGGGRVLHNVLESELTTRIRATFYLSRVDMFSVVSIYRTHCFVGTNCCTASHNRRRHLNIYLAYIAWYYMQGSARSERYCLRRSLQSLHIAMFIVLQLIHQ